MSKARFSKHITWYRQLQVKERARLDIVCAHILNHAARALEDLNGETWRRKLFAHEESLPGLYRKEQRRVSELVDSQPLNNQIELSTLLNSILFEIRAGEISLADLYYLPSDVPSGGPDPWSFKWFEGAVVTASYLIYAVQIEGLLQSGVLEEDRRWSPVPGNADNEILLLLTRQVIMSVGGMDECLNGKIRRDPKGDSLRLEDILVSRTTAKEVKELYRAFLGGREPNEMEQTKFLRHLYDKGYYTKKPKGRDYEAIGRNEFGPGFNYNRTNPYKPPMEGDELWNWSPYNKIPDLR